jgi:hypothetical protein
MGRERSREGFDVEAFRRYACKMATGSGKTTVTGMLYAWSILNKIASRADARFSEVGLVCPNLTIRGTPGRTRPAARRRVCLPEARSRPTPPDAAISPRPSTSQELARVLAQRDECGVDGAERRRSGSVGGAIASAQA